AVIRKVFTGVGILSIVIAAFVSGLGARSVVRPLITLIGELKESEKSGTLPVDFRIKSSTIEVDQLVAAFRRSAEAVRSANGRLVTAHIDFIRAMATALDARDVYTAGHSRRVSEYSCAIAQEMNLPEDKIEAIRIGALLHDIGKIGVPDAVLQK